MPGQEGLLLCPEGAAAVAAYVRSRQEGRISTDDRCVAFNCGSGFKYPMPPAAGLPDHTRSIDRTTLG